MPVLELRSAFYSMCAAIKKDNLLLEFKALKVIYIHRNLKSNDEIISKMHINTAKLGV